MNLFHFKLLIYLLFIEILYNYAYVGRKMKNERYIFHKYY